MQMIPATGRRMAADEGLTAEEIQQVDAMRRKMGFAMIRQWKINKALYKTYGGRIIYQQLGPEPLDAYRQYFEERNIDANVEFSWGATEAKAVEGLVDAVVEITETGSAVEQMNRVPSLRHPGKPNLSDRLASPGACRAPRALLLLFAQFIDEVRQ